MKLENWGAIDLLESLYRAPECAVWGLSGEVQGHKKFCNGDRINTSALVRLQQTDTGYVATTRSGSVYELGEPDPKFLAVLERDGKTLEKAMDNLSIMAGFQGVI
jgi:hypothetical protein